MAESKGGSEVQQQIESLTQFIKSGSEKKFLKTLEDKKTEKLAEEDLLAKMQRLGKITKNKKAAKKFSRNKGTIATLLDSIKTRPRFTKMVEYSIQCLTNLAVDEVSAEELIDEGVLDVLMNVLKTNPYNEEIQRAVNKCLSALSVTSDTAQVVGNKGVAGPLVFSMSKHVAPDTLISTCTASVHVMKNDGNIKYFVEAGAIPACFSMIKSNANDSEVLAASARVLSRIADVPEYCQSILESGSLAYLIKGLEQNPDNIELVEHVLSLINKICKNCPAAFELIQKMGAVNAIVAALEMNPHIAKLIYLGRDALKYLTGKDDVSLALMGVGKGLNLASAMALSTLCSLALIPENVAYIVEKGGINLIIAAIQAALADRGNEFSSRIIESGCRCLGRLAIEEKYIAEIIKAGGASLLCTVLSECPDDELITAAALAAIAALLTTKENASYMAKQNAIPFAVSALLKHIGSTRVAEPGLLVLNKFCSFDETIAQVYKEGGIGAILKVMKQNILNTDIVGACSAILSKLCVSEDAAKAIYGEKGFPIILEALLKHPESDKLTLEILKLLESIAKYPSQVKGLKDANTMNALLTTMAAFPGHQEIHAECKKIMNYLSGKAELQMAFDELVLNVGRLKKATADTQNAIAHDLLKSVSMIGKLATIAENAEFLVKAGCIPVLQEALSLAAALKNCEDREELITEIIKAISLLAQYADLSGFLKSGALRIALDNCLAHPSNEMLALHTFQLADLISNDLGNLGILKDDLSLEKIIAIARAHPFDYAILALAARCIGKFCSDEGNIQYIIQKGGVEVLVDALSALMNDAANLELALLVLANICTDASSIPHILSAGGLAAILEVMRTHPDNAGIIIACMKILGSIARADENSAKEIAKMGFVPICVKATRQHYDNELLVQASMELFDPLSAAEGNYPKLKENDVLGLAKWARDQFNENAGLVQSATNVIQNIEKEEKIDAKHFRVGDCLQLIKRIKDPNTTIEVLMADLAIVSQLSVVQPAVTEFCTNQGLEVLAALINKSKKKKQGDIYGLAVKAYADMAKAFGNDGLESLSKPAMMDALLDSLDEDSGFDVEVDPDAKSKALAMIAKMGGKSKVPFDKKKALPALLKLFKTSQNDTVLVATAKALADLSDDDALAADIAELGGIRELLEAIGRNAGREDFLPPALRMIGNLAMNDELKTKIGLEGGIPLIIKLMQVFPGNAKLIKNCNYSLANLSFNNPSNCAIIKKYEGMEQILVTMANHPTQESLLESAMCTLSNMCYKNDSNKEFITKVGGAKAIVDTILGNFNSTDLVLTGFRALGNLAYFAPNITTIIEQGGVQGLVAGLNVHAKDSDIIQTALLVLTNLTSDLSADNMLIMAQEGAVQAIVDVTRNNLGSVEVEIASLSCLCNLAIEEYNATMIVRQGGVEAAVAALKAHDFDLELNDKGMRLLSLLSLPPENCEKIILDGAPDVLAKVMKSFANNKKIIIDCLRSVYNLSYNEDLANSMGNKDVIRSVFDLANASVDTSSMVMECLRSLGGLARSERNANAFAEQVMKYLILTLSKHHADANFVGFAMTFLGNLCVHEVAAESCIPANIIPTMVEMTKEHTKDIPTVVKCLRAIENMALAANSIKDAMKKEKVLESVERVGKLYSQVDEVVKACEAASNAITKRKVKAAKNMNAPGGRKRANLIFDPNGVIDETKLSKEMRNLLLAGTLLTKHSNKAKPRPRHVFITRDLKHLSWKDPKKPLEKPVTLRVEHIRTVEKGRCTPQLQRKKFGKFLAKEECSFSVQSKERTVDFEAENEEERDKWVVALKTWVAFDKFRRKQLNSFD